MHSPRTGSHSAVFTLAQQIVFRTIGARIKRISVLRLWQITVCIRTVCGSNFDIRIRIYAESILLLCETYLLHSQVEDVEDDM